MDVLFISEDNIALKDSLGKVAQIFLIEKLYIPSAFQKPLFETPLVLDSVV